MGLTVIVAIEGGVGSGKSTLLEKLKSTFPDFLAVPEYFSMISDSKAEGVLALTEDEKFSLFLKLEKERLDNFKRSGHAHAILDRSFLSLMSYQHAVGRYDTLDQSLLEKDHIEDNYIVPDLVIHLDVDDSVRRQRVEQRGFEVLPLLLEPRYNDSIRDFYDDVCGAVQVLHIDTTVMPADSVADMVIEAIRTARDVENKASKFAVTMQAFSDPMAVRPDSPTATQTAARRKTRREPE